MKTQDVFIVVGIKFFSFLEVSFEKSMIERREKK